MDDRELLREYVERQSEPAFAELVARHVNLVYATALRVVGDASAAQDVAQAVFIQLARKAWVVRDGNALVGWLYRAAYRTALDTIRSEQRRRQRETEAMILTEQNSDPAAAWEKLAPLLDEAMQGLNRAEQNALLLRYFDGKTMRETGAALGTTEAAAQMRVTRALEKMRTHFARNGVTVATGALVSILAANTSHAAPAGLATRASSAAKAGVAVGGLSGLAWRIFFMSTKTKIITASAIVLALLASLSFKLAQMAEAPLATSTKVVNAAQAKTSPLAIGSPRAVEMPVVPPANATLVKSTAANTTKIVTNATAEQGQIASASGTSSNQNFVSEIFGLNADVLMQLGLNSSSNPDDISDQLKKKFIDNGIDFPAGSSLTILGKNTRVSVNNTPENIAKLRDFLSTLNTLNGGN